MEMTPVAQAIDIAYSPNPVLPAQGRICRPHPALPGQTVRDVLLASGIDPHQEIFIRHNGELLPVSAWDSTVPAEGDTLQVLAAVSGGGGDSNPLQIIAMVALTYFTMGAGATWLGSLQGTLAGSMLGAAAFMAGSMLLGSVFKPDTPSTDQEAAKTSASYSLSGGSNRTRPYEPLPVVLGRYRVFPDLNSKPYVEYLDNEQYLYQVFNFGLGQPQLDDPRIGDTPLSAFQGVDVVWPDANGTFAPETGFFGNVDSTAGGEIKQETGAIVRATALDTVRIGLDIEGMLFAVDKKGRYVEKSAQIRVRYRAVGGAWMGFVADNMQPVTAYWSRGYWQTVETAPARYDPATGQMLPAETGQRWVQLGFDSNLSPGAHTENQADGVHMESVGWGDSAETVSYNTIWRWVSAGTDPRPSQALESNGTDTLTLRGSSSETKRWSLYRTVPAGQYEVEVTRLTPDESSTSSASQLNWSNLKSYQADSGQYKNQTVVGVKIRASGQLNGVVNQLSCIAQTKAFVLTGTGWQLQGTLNPAWWYLHWATGRRDEAGRLLYGCGLDLDRIDVAAIAAWAAFCDQNKLSFSTVIDSKQSADDVLQMIARCGLASPSWAPGKLSVVWDRVNASVAAAFGMSNILAGTFQVKYLTDQLADEIIVDYLDAETWESASVRVTAPGLVGVPQRVTQITLQGCTSNAQALKYARVVMAGNVYRRRRITWETDAEGFVCTRGDVVRLSHDLTQWDYSGRLVSVTGNAVLLSRAVPRSGGVDHLTVVRPDGTQTHYTAVPGSGDDEVLTLNQSVNLQDGYEPRDHLFFYGPLSTPGKRVKILAVEPVDQRRLRILATDDDPAYYAAWEGVWNDPQINSRLVAPISVSNLLLRSAIREIDGRLINQVSATWRNGSGVAQCAVDVSLDGEFQTRFEGIKTGGKTFEVENGTVRVGVTPYSLDSVAGPTAFAELIVSTAPPLPAPMLTATPVLFAIQLSWLFASDRNDIAYTEIRWAPVEDVEQGILLSVVPYPGRDYLHAGLQPGVEYVYWARVLDTRGVPSEWSNAAKAMVTDDASDLLDMLKDALGMQHLADELAVPIAQIPLVQMAQDWDALTAEINRLGAQTLVRGERVHSFALISTEQTLRTEEDEALAEQISTVAAGLEGSIAAIQTQQTALVTANAANASLINNVQARLDTGDFAAVKTSATASADKITGLEAKYTIQVNANGHVAGVSLLAGGNTSAFTVLADKFLFAQPNGEGQPKQLMVMGTVNGVSALGLDGNLIVDGSIVAQKIDTRGLTIRDTSGNIILGSGTGLPVGYVNGLGALATQNSVDYSAVTGSKPPSNADKTSLNTAAGIAGQGAFATLNQINSSNISTYIAALAVDTLYIAGEAVTVPRAGYGQYYASVSFYTPVPTNVQLNVVFRQGTGRPSTPVSLYVNGSLVMTESPGSGTLGSMAYAFVAPAGNNTAFVTTAAVGDCYIMMTSIGLKR